MAKCLYSCGSQEGGGMAEGCNKSRGVQATLNWWVSQATDVFWQTRASRSIVQFIKKLCLSPLSIPDKHVRRFEKARNQATLSEVVKTKRRLHSSQSLQEHRGDSFKILKCGLSQTAWECWGTNRKCVFLFTANLIRLLSVFMSSPAVVTPSRLLFSSSKSAPQLNLPPDFISNTQAHISSIPARLMWTIISVLWYRWVLPRYKIIPGKICPLDLVSCVVISYKYETTQTEVH